LFAVSESVIMVLMFRLLWCSEMGCDGEIVYRVYRDGDEVGIVEVLRKCFSGFDRFKLDAETWLSYKVDYGFKTDYSLVAEVDGKIVGHVQLILRRLKLGRDYVNVGGIANVSTDPEYRGRGIATNLMRMATDLCRKEGIHLSALMTSYGYVAHRIYRRLGYADTYFAQRFVGEREEVERVIKEIGDVRGVVVREFEEEDLLMVMRLYNAFSEGYSGVAWRDADYWRNKIVNKRFGTTWIFDEEGSEFLVVEKDGKVSGYSYFAIGSRCKRAPIGRERGVLIELVAGDGRSLRALLVESLRRMLEANVKTFELYLPPYEPYRSLLRGFPLFVERGVYMSNVVNLRGLIEECVPSFNQFLEECDREFNIRMGLRSRYGDVVLVIKGNEVIVEDGKADVVFEINYHTFTRMVHFIEDVVKAFLDGRINVVKSMVSLREALQCLEILFPRMRFFIWSVDHW